MSLHILPKTSALERDSGLLPKHPPLLAARWAGWLLLSVFAALIAFAATFRLPETVIAPFVLIPAEGTEPLRASISGELAVAHVQPGQTVKAGEELFQIRSDSIRNDHAKLRQLLEEQRALAERIRKLDEAHTAELAIKDAEIVQAERELEFRDQHLATARDLLNRAEQLSTNGLIAQVELLEHRLVTSESEKDRVLTEKLKQQFHLQRQERVTARARQSSDEKAETEKLLVQIAALQEQLADSTNDVKSVRAPYDAVILSVPQRTPGSVVAEGAELCQLARMESRPRVRLALPESGVAKLRLGQSVRLFFTAFPYQRHGTRQAEIAWISPAPLSEKSDPPESSFFALADLAPDEANPLAVQIGMKGEARILLGHRTLVSRLLEPIRALRERTVWP